MKMDERQYAAVHQKGHNILVSASAGAGKTRVLVERLVKRCVEDRISVEEILAVTFTSAAAAEMKNRVAGSLNDLLEKTTDEEDIAYLKQQIILLDSAEITTIDAFCLKIIKKYYSMIGLDPATATNILSDGEKEQLQIKAFQNALAYEMEHNKEEITNLFELYEPRPEKYADMKEIVFNILTHAESSEDPLQWLANARDCYHKINSFNDFDEEVKTFFTNNINLQFNAVVDEFNQMLDYAKDSEKLMKKYDMFTKISVRLENCKRHLDAHNYDMFRDSFILFGEEDAKTPTDSKAEEYKKIRTNWYDKTLTNLTSTLYELDLFVQDNNDLEAQVHTLIDLCLKTRENFIQYKQDNACMDFSDMERYAYLILQANDYAVSKIYKNRFKEVMVDEFQDTSTLQNQMIETLSAPGTIFRVGDVKQSIYRFRGAKPSLMRSIMEDPNTEQIVLEHNYRSRENIVKFCNLLFGCIMNVPGCKDVYTENDIVSTGAPHQILEKPDPCKFVLVHRPVDENGEEIKNGKGDKQLKAEWISEKMYSLIEEEGYSFKDFAVLVRNHGDKRIIRNAFDYAGIPYNIDTREGFFQSPLSKTMLAIFKCILDSKDELNLLTMVTSSMYQLNDNDLASLKIQYGSIYKGIKEEHPNVLEDLSQFRKTVQTTGLVSLLEEIAMKNDFFVKLDETSQANFDFLFEKTMKLEQKTSNFLDLINFMESSEDEKSSEAMAIGKNDDVVEVTTIHQSKGLQYKVVFLWSTNSNQFKDKQQDIIVDDDLYLGLTHYDLPYRTRRITPRRIAIEYKNNLEDLEEYTRLLYVALTRPMHKLYMVDIFKDEYAKEDMSISLLNKRKGFTGLVLSAKIHDLDLFQIDHVNAVEPIKRESIKKKYDTSLPIFDDSKITYLDDLKTPSSSKAESKLQPLTFKQEDGGTNYGTLMHETMEQMPNRLLTINDLDGYDLSTNDKNKILAFHNSDLYKKALTGTIYREFPFYIEQHKTRIHGIMDFVSILDDEIILVDYKTDHADEDTIKQRYTGQLTEYKKALNILYPDKEVKAYAYSFYLETPIAI